MANKQEKKKKNDKSAIDKQAQGRKNIIENKGPDAPGGCIDTNILIKSNILIFSPSQTYIDSSTKKVILKMACFEMKLETVANLT